MNMTRRGFLRDAGLMSLLGVGGCRLAEFATGANIVGGLRLGVQMWSVDKLWKGNPAEAFRRLRSMGYVGVQSFAFYNRDWNELEKMLDGEGLKIVDMPFYMKTLAKGGEVRFLEFCDRFGIDFAFEPWNDFKTKAEWRRHAGELAEIRARWASRGIRVGYHNHQHEIKNRIDGVRPYDILRDAGLDFELDVGHARLAGDDPVKLLNALVGRVPSIHAKPGGGNAVGGVGDANDWAGIFRAAAAAGTRWAIVECETRRDTYDDVDESMRNLKSLSV